MSSIFSYTFAPDMNSIETKDRLPAPATSQIFSSLLIALGFVLLGLFVGQMLGFLVSWLLFGMDMAYVSQIMLTPSEDAAVRIPLMLIQAGSTLFGFILAPLLHLKLIDKEPETAWFQQHSLSVVLVGVVFLLTLAFITANSVVIEWNMHLDFGAFSTSFGEWARAKEESLSELTQFITQFDSTGSLLAGLIVIAILPAIGEEMVFRGILQRKLQQLTHRPHLAIWLAAFFFSAIHLQFYGFFPRLLLGALFGYIYYWSDNLWYPIAAHFLNNAFTLIMLYLYQQKATDIDLESTDSVPWSMALLALVVGAGLLVYFRQTAITLRDTHDG